MATKTGRSPNRVIRLVIEGATLDVPLGMRAEGKSCLAIAPTAGVRGKGQSGAGHYYYVASPAKGRAVLVHSEGKGEAQKLTIWKSTKTGDAPVLGTTNVTEKSALKALNAVSGSIPTMPKGAEPVFRGRWTGYIECTPTGPEIVVYRDVASYARIAIVSNLNKQKKMATWEWAVVLKPGKAAKWYTQGTKKEYTGKSVKSFDDAYKTAYTVLLQVVSQACVTQHTGRRASFDEAWRVIRGMAGSRTKGEIKAAATRPAKVRRQIGKGEIVKSRAKVTGARRTRKLTDPTSTQTKLVGSYISIAKGHYKGRKAKVESISENARGTYNRGSGGARLHVLLDDGVKAKINQYSANKQTFRKSTEKSYDTAKAKLERKTERASAGATAAATAPKSYTNAVGKWRKIKKDHKYAGFKGKAMKVTKFKGEWRVLLQSGKTKHSVTLADSSPAKKAAKDVNPVASASAPSKPPGASRHSSGRGTTTSRPSKPVVTAGMPISSPTSISPPPQEAMETVSITETVGESETAGGQSEEAAESEGLYGALEGIDLG